MGITGGVFSEILLRRQKEGPFPQTLGVTQPPGYGDNPANSGKIYLTFYDHIFDRRNVSKQYALASVVHEVAHVWNAAASGYFSSMMGGRTHSSIIGEGADGIYDPGSEPGASEYANGRTTYGNTGQYGLGFAQGEDWAEAVAAYVYAGKGQFSTFSRDQSIRGKFVGEQFYLFSHKGYVANR